MDDVYEQIVLTPPSDRARLLVEHCAFWEVVEKGVRAYRDRYYRFLPLETQEIVSDVGLRAAVRVAREAFSSAEQVRDRTLYFIRRETQNVCDRIQRRSKREAPSQASCDILSKEEFQLARDAYERNSKTKELRRGLALLPADLREVLVLRYLGQMTLEEVAKATGRTTSSTWRLCQKAHRKLKKLID